MDTLSQKQIDAMMGMSLHPDQAAAVLGHASTVNNSFLSRKTGDAAPTTAFSPEGIQTAKHQIGSVLPTAGAVGGGLMGAAGGAVVGGPVGAYAGGVAGAGAGAALGETANEAIQGQQLQPTEIAKQGGLNAAYEAVGGPILSGAGKALGKAAGSAISGTGKVLGKIGDAFGGEGGIGALSTLKEGAGKIMDVIREPFSPAVSRATKAVQSTADTMTKKERAEAALGGRMSDTIFGKGKFAPSDLEERAGEMLAGKVGKNPVSNLSTIQEEIAHQGRGAEQYLEQNAKPITNAEDHTMFQQKRIESEKYMTPTAVNAYDDQIKVFQKVLKDFGEYNTSNYYKALKDFEDNVTAHLPKGKEALLDEGGSARLQAAKDVRSIVRSMIGRKNEEFSGKMFDLASLYEARDNSLAKALENGSFAKRFAQNHPFITPALGAGAGLAGLDAVNTVKHDIGL